MKKLISVIAFVLVALSVYAQDIVIGEYRMGASVFPVLAAYDSSNHLLVHFGVKGESSDDLVNIIIQGEKDIINFKKQFIALQNKYIEWKNVAIKNDITDMSKMSYIKFPNVKFGWHDGTKWNFNSDTILRFRFIVYESNVIPGTVVYSIADTGTLGSTQKWYFQFRSEEDMQSLIDLLDVQMIKSKLAKENNIDALFK